MDRLEAGIYGFMFISLGISALVSWGINRDTWLRNIGRRHSWFWNKVGLTRPKLLIRFDALMLDWIQWLLGVIFVLGGSCMLFYFFTGRDWALHYARWSDRWPF
jgi:hypothetical protein